MNVKMRHRIIGVVVVIAVLAIVVPLLFSKSKDFSKQQQNLSLTIPEAPQAPATQPAPQQVMAPVSDAKAVAPSDQNSAPVSDAAPVAVTNTSVVPKQAVQAEPAKPILKPVVPVAVKASPAKAMPVQAVQPAGPWVVRVGVFGDADNVKALVARLQKQGINAITQTLQRPGKSNLIKVLAGPVATKQAASKLKQQLQSSLKLNGKVQAYKAGS